MLPREGRILFCLGMQQTHSCLKTLVRSLFHTNYDDELEDTLIKCRKSSKSLCAQITTRHFEHRMDTSILRILKIILQSKRPKRTYRFFFDLAKLSFEYEDYQTANVLCLALTHDMLTFIKKPKHAEEILHDMKEEYGYPSYDKHVYFFDKLRSPNKIPSVFAFIKFVKRKRFMNKTDQVSFALNLLDIYKYLKYDEKDVLPLYNLINRQETAHLKQQIEKLKIANRKIKNSKSKV